MLCIHVPIKEIHWPNQNNLKFLCRSAGNPEYIIFVETLLPI